MQKRGKTALTLVGFAVMLAALLALMVSIGAGKDGFDLDEFFTYGLAIRISSPFEHPNRVVDQRQGVFGLSHGERSCARISERL
ncbi:MAG: hypothetical protein ACLS7Z_07525 [Christensenellales bacterium]